MSESNQGEQLYAGKYKTVGELEEGYKNAAKIFQENDDLKKKFEEVTKVPDAYNVPADLTLHESDLEAVRNEAKNSGLTQAQFEKLARERNARSASKAQSFEEAKKALGADNTNVLQDFLKKSYPDKAAEVLLKQAIVNKEVREQILEQRNKALNSTVPGGGNATGYGNHTVTEKDVLKAREEMTNSRGRARVEAQSRYIALQRHRAHQKQQA
ncbi:MAG TPA: hypothetical protein VLK33_08220 [Terriglobales bacterium]|nr:hypothetical protein [Terriglobales bacterium]